MFLFCVRVSCHEQVLYGPKWVSIEETSTLCDVLRCATGDKYLSRKLKVVVASEKSLRDLSFVKLALPVVILDKNDKKVVSFLLKPEKTVITVSCSFLIFYTNIHGDLCWIFSIFDAICRNVNLIYSQWISVLFSDKIILVWVCWI